MKFYIKHWICFLQHVQSSFQKALLSQTAFLCYKYLIQNQKQINRLYIPTYSLSLDYLQKFSFISEAKFSTGLHMLYACLLRHIVDFCTTYSGVGLSFPFYMGMLFLIWKELGMVNFPIHGEIFFSCIRGFATHTGKIPSLILSR